LLPQLSKRAFGDQLSGRDDADAVGHAFGDFENVGGHDYGAAGADPLLQQSLDVTGGERIEAGERLVQDDQARVMHQRAGQRHLLAHALGKSLAALVQMRLQPERHQELLRGAFGNPGIDAPEAGDEFEIFQRRQLVVDHRLVGDPGHDLPGGDGIAQGIDAEDRD